MFRSKCFFLVQTDYFRYFRVDLQASCPYWGTADEFCTLKECATEEVENALEKELSKLDSTIDKSKISEVKKAERLDTGWVKEDEGEAHFVDLTLNPEQYTGYRGKRAQRVWEKIYEKVFIF
jgi:ERO1-like protein alpha